MRYAQIIDGTVSNVIVWDGKTELEHEGELVILDAGSPVSIGWLYNGTTFTNPEPEPVLS